MKSELKERVEAHAAAESAHKSKFTAVKQNAGELAAKLKAERAAAEAERDAARAELEALKKATFQLAAWGSAAMPRPVVASSAAATTSTTSRAELRAEPRTDPRTDPRADPRAEPRTGRGALSDGGGEQAARGTKLIVQNIVSDINAEDIHDLFSSIGEVLVLFGSSFFIVYK